MGLIVSEDELTPFSLIIHDLSKLRGSGGGDSVLDVDYKNEGPSEIII